MNRVECLPILLICRIFWNVAERAMEMDSVLVVCGAAVAYGLYAVVRYVYTKTRQFQNYVDMIYFLEATSAKSDPDRCQRGFLKMPRSRRRHHSRSRSRSRSHSHDRDREAKRRKVESYDSPHHRRSVSSEPEDRTDITTTNNAPCDETVIKGANETIDESVNETIDESVNETIDESANETMDDSANETIDESANETIDESVNETIDESFDKQSESDVSMVTAEEGPGEKADLALTPKKTPLKTVQGKSRKLTPKQIARRKEAEKKRQERLEEKQRKKQEAKKLKQIKDEQRQKEKEEKLKEKEKMLKEKEDKKKEKEEKKKEKEIKKKEKEEKEELKRKEKEQEKLEKQQKMEEKNKEKQKMEEAKLKAAAAFTKFFKKLPDNENEKLEVIVVKGRVAFMPFEKKADMKLAPITRKAISVENKSSFETLLKDQNAQCLYLVELKNGKEIGKCGKTWPKQDESDDVVIIGETIQEEKHKIKKMRAKYFHFRENQRPAYYGTFRKKSGNIGPRKPFGKDEEQLDYEVDSDEEWEEEPEGESLKGTDNEEEDKENEGNDDYEVDNDFFVPHGHLSEDEVDDEAEGRLDPELHKAKLKLLKSEFEEERKSKTQKIRPIIVGGYWQGKIKDTTAQLSVNKYLVPYSFVGENGKVDIVDRSNLVVGSIGKRKAKLLSSEHLPLFLKFIHGSSKKGKELIKKFIENLGSKGVEVDVSHMAVGKQLRKYAEWTSNKEEGVKKRCWLVREQYQKKFNLDLTGKLDVC